MTVICSYCNKEFSSYQSRCNHTRKFHKLGNENVTLNKHIISNKINIKSSENQLEINSNLDKLSCKYCKKIFKHLQSRWRHEKTCKNNKINIEEENMMLKEELADIKNQLALLLNKKETQPKTSRYDKINKQLNNSGQIGAVGNNNAIGDNNTVINNTFVKFGPVEFNKLLSEKQKLFILNSPFMSLEESIKLIHFNDKRPEYNNIFITNMRDKLAYIFDGKKFISVNKNDVIKNLINNHADEIETLFDNYKDKLTEFKSTRVQAFIDLINDDDEYKDENNKTYENYKAYKIDDIKRLIYNNSDNKKFTELRKSSINTKEEQDIIL